MSDDHWTRRNQWQNHFASPVPRVFTSNGRLHVVFNPAPIVLFSTPVFLSPPPLFLVPVLASRSLAPAQHRCQCNHWPPAAPRCDVIQPEARAPNHNRGEQRTPQRCWHLRPPTSVAPSSSRVCDGPSEQVNADPPTVDNAPYLPSSATAGATVHNDNATEMVTRSTQTKENEHSDGDYPGTESRETPSRVTLAGGGDAAVGPDPPVSAAQIPPGIDDNSVDRDEDELTAGLARVERELMDMMLSDDDHVTLTDDETSVWPMVNDGTRPPNVWPTKDNYQLAQVWSMVNAGTRPPNVWPAKDNYQLAQVWPTEDNYQLGQIWSTTSGGNTNSTPTTTSGIVGTDYISTAISGNGETRPSNILPTQDYYQLWTMYNDGIRENTNTTPTTSGNGGTDYISTAINGNGGTRLSNILPTQDYYKIWTMYNDGIRGHTNATRTTTNGSHGNGGTNNISTTTSGNGGSRPSNIWLTQDGYQIDNRGYTNATPTTSSGNGETDNISTAISANGASRRLNIWPTEDYYLIRSMYNDVYRGNTNATSTMTRGNCGTNNISTPISGNGGTNNISTPISGNGGTNNISTPISGNGGTNNISTPISGNGGTNNISTPISGNGGTNNISMPISDNSGTNNISTPISGNGGTNISTPISGYGGTNNISTPISGYGGTNNISTPISGYGGTNNISTPISGYGGTNNISTPISGYSGTNNISTPISGYGGTNNISTPISGYGGTNNISTPISGYGGTNNISAPISGNGGTNNISTPISGYGGTRPSNIWPTRDNYKLAQIWSMYNDGNRGYTNATLTTTSSSGGSENLLTTSSDNDGSRPSNIWPNQDYYKLAQIWSIYNNNRGYTNATSTTTRGNGGTENVSMFSGNGGTDNISTPISDNGGRRRTSIWATGDSYQFAQIWSMYNAWHRGNTNATPTTSGNGGTDNIPTMTIDNGETRPSNVCPTEDDYYQIWSMYMPPEYRQYHGYTNATSVTTSGNGGTSNDTTTTVNGQDGTDNFTSTTTSRNGGTGETSTSISGYNGVMYFRGTTDRGNSGLPNVSSRTFVGPRYHNARTRRGFPCSPPRMPHGQSGHGYPPPSHSGNNVPSTRISGHGYANVRTRTFVGSGQYVNTRSRTFVRRGRHFNARSRTFVGRGHNYYVRSRTMSGNVGASSVRFTISGGERGGGGRATRQAEPAGDAPWAHQEDEVETPGQVSDDERDDASTSPYSTDDDSYWEERAELMWTVMLADIQRQVDDMRNDPDMSTPPAL